MNWSLITWHRAQITTRRVMWWWPGPCSFNTISGFRYGASLRGLRPNGFLSGFISIRMARFNVGSPRLSQPSSFTRAWDLLPSSFTRRSLNLSKCRKLTVERCIVDWIMSQQSAHPAIFNSANKICLYISPSNLFLLTKLTGFIYYPLSLCWWEVNKLA